MYQQRHFCHDAEIIYSPKIILQAECRGIEGSNFIHRIIHAVESRLGSNMTTLPSNQSHNGDIQIARPKLRTLGHKIIRQEGNTFMYNKCYLLSDV